jgi:outer membrane receptor for ferric coprogen and ferric-rhodotorulic acid
MNMPMADSTPQPGTFAAGCAGRRLRPWPAWPRRRRRRPRPPKAETVMPVIKATGSAERQGKDGVQATTSRIGKGQQELRDIPQSVTVVTEKLIDDRNLDT